MLNNSKCTVLGKLMHSTLAKHTFCMSAVRCEIRMKCFAMSNLQATGIQGNFQYSKFVYTVSHNTFSIKWKVFKFTTELASERIS